MEFLTAKKFSVMVPETITQLSPDIIQLQDPDSVGCGLQHLHFLKASHRAVSLSILIIYCTPIFC